MNDLKFITFKLQLVHSDRFTVIVPFALHAGTYINIKHDPYSMLEVTLKYRSSCELMHCIVTCAMCACAYISFCKNKIKEIKTGKLSYREIRKLNQRRNLHSKSKNTKKLQLQNLCLKNSKVVNIFLIFSSDMCLRFCFCFCVM